MHVQMGQRLSYVFNEKDGVHVDIIKVFKINTV